MVKCLHYTILLSFHFKRYIEIKHIFLFEFPDIELEGYIHTLSPIKKTNNKSPYFDCFVQTSNTSKVRAVSYETKSAPLCNKLIVSNHL